MMKASRLQKMVVASFIAIIKQCRYYNRISHKTIVFKFIAKLKLDSRFNFSIILRVVWCGWRALKILVFELFWFDVYIAECIVTVKYLLESIVFAASFNILATSMKLDIKVWWQFWVFKICFTFINCWVETLCAQIGFFLLAGLFDWHAMHWPAIFFNFFCIIGQ